VGDGQTRKSFCCLRLPRMSSRGILENTRQRDTSPLLLLNRPTGNSFFRQEFAIRPSGKTRIDLSLAVPIFVQTVTGFSATRSAYGRYGSRARRG
jgi:hypothetical protein